MLKILCGNSKLSQGTTRRVLIVHADLPGLPCAMETCCMNILPLIDTHGLLKLEKTGTKYMSLSSLCCGCNIMHSCHQRPKHAAWVFAFEMFLQGRMKERLRGLACKAQQLFWGFCDCAKNGHKYSSLCHLWMQTIQSSGMTFKAWCIPVCLCAPNLRSSLTYTHSYCVENPLQI